ncbi:MAG: flagellar hook-length control protein FliK [Methylomonas sp.]|nr:flagellar hook-length control protein FliK [Methylomonas sp.]
MDIKLPLNISLQPAIDKAVDAGLNLKLNQVVEAKVIETQILLDSLPLKIDDKSVQADAKTIANRPLSNSLPLEVDAKMVKAEAKAAETRILLNSLTLKINDKLVTAEAKPPIALEPGQTLQLKVVKLLPTPELKVLLPSTARPTGMPPEQLSDMPTLRLLNPAITTQSPSPDAGKATSSALPSALTDTPRLQATIIAVVGDKITLQLTPTAFPVSVGPTPQATPQQNPALLTLNSNQLLVNDNSPSVATLKEGAQIQLQAVKTGNTPVFLVESLGHNEEQKVIDAIKRLLPIAASGTPLLDQLQQLLPRLQADASVAETLKKLAQEILRNLPAGTNLAEAPQLKKAFSDSGLFLESKLAALLSGKTDIALHSDFKLKLNRLVQLLGQEVTNQADNETSDLVETLKASLQKTQNTLAGLTLDQLNSLPKDESPKQSWIVELPFVNDNGTDTVKIAIEQDKTAPNDSAQKNWAVSITITPPELGTIHCRLSCYDGSINTRFWSDAADTVKKINTHLDYLKQQFEKKGLSPGFMEAHQGQPTPSDSLKAAIPRLLSEKA